MSKRLETVFAGAAFKNPVALASGTCGFGREFNEYFDIQKLGGLCSKGLTLHPCLGNDGIRVWETASGVMNSVGMENPGIQHFIDCDLERMNALDLVNIVNMGGHSEEDYLEGVELLNQHPLDLLELNISCPNTKAGCMSFGLKAEVARDIVKKVRAICKHKLVVKLSPNAEDVVALAKQTALFDTVAALVAALVIIPACFAYGLDVGSGPSLLFVTLPHILQDIPLGRLFAVILYTAMVFAGVSSLQNMFEAVGESLLHRFPKLNRKAMLALLCVICLGIGLNMEPIFKWGPWMDIVSIYIIPIGATLGALSWFWIMKRDELMEEINRGAKKPSGPVWYNVGRFFYVPCAIILCCVALFLKVAF